MLDNTHHTADVIHIALSLAYNRVSPTEVAKLKMQKLTEWLRAPLSRRMIPRPYYVVPYLVNQSMDAQRKLHLLAFPAEGSDAEVAHGFGTGAPFDLEYSIALGGVFQTFTCRAGLHRTAGAEGKVVFEVLVNGKSVYTSDPVCVGNKPVKISAHCRRPAW